MGMFDDLVPKKGAFDDLIPAKKIDSTPEELSFGEKAVSLLPDSVQEALGGFMGGNVRGSAMGRMAMGAADPGVALVQLGANAIGQGRQVNDVIKRAEERYQSARGQAGSTGFDPMRMAGNVAITAPLAGVGGVGTTLAGTAARGAASGAGFAALEPVTNGGDDFWSDKAKQAGTGAVVGAVAAPLVNAVGRVISPNASTNPKLQLLREEGVDPSIGQSLGGWANRLEEKAQSLPILGDAIRASRQRGRDQLADAAFDRGAAPIGETVAARGSEGIKELKDKLGKAYEEVIPKLSVDALDPTFVGKLSNLRSMAQSLPPEEARQFDNIITREIDNRLAPNGMLSGQNLKDAWNALRDEAAGFAKSGDKYQQDLGRAIKQTFQELKDHVTNTNPPEVVAALKGADLGYANFKRLQRAAGSVAADSGEFSPSQLHSAIKALDNSRDKARFSEGDALMQDLSSAGKSILGDKVADSGTAGRLMMGAGALASGAVNPLIPAALVGGAAAYTPPVQNMLRYLTTKRWDSAPQMRNYLRKIAPYAALTAGPVSMENRK